eukprot:GHVH01010998.1.p1 GENE.GHVH01010998.1~~GHVH01010998.1.p1  ORF type:complete len:1086 (+),score=162.60 GHVH01010998.1:355-3612(+)
MSNELFRVRLKCDTLRGVHGHGVRDELVATKLIAQRNVQYASNTRRAKMSNKIGKLPHTKEVEIRWRHISTSTWEPLDDYIQRCYPQIKQNAAGLPYKRTRIEDDSDEEGYVVETILAMKSTANNLHPRVFDRLTADHIHYLVKWDGFSISESTWERYEAFNTDEEGELLPDINATINRVREEAICRLSNPSMTSEKLNKRCNEIARANSLGTRLRLKPSYTTLLSPLNQVNQQNHQSMISAKGPSIVSASSPLLQQRRRTTTATASSTAVAQQQKPNQKQRQAHPNQPPKPVVIAPRQVSLAPLLPSRPVHPVVSNLPITYNPPPRTTFPIEQQQRKATRQSKAISAPEAVRLLDQDRMRRIAWMARIRAIWMQRNGITDELIGRPSVANLSTPSSTTDRAAIQTDLSECSLAVGPSTIKIPQEVVNAVSLGTQRVLEIVHNPKNTDCSLTAPSPSFIDDVEDDMAVVKKEILGVQKDEIGVGTLELRKMDFSPVPPHVPMLVNEVVVEAFGLTLSLMNQSRELWTRMCKRRPECSIGASTFKMICVCQNIQPEMKKDVPSKVEDAISKLITTCPSFAISEPNSLPVGGCGVHGSPSAICCTSCGLWQHSSCAIYPSFEVSSFEGFEVSTLNEFGDKVPSVRKLTGLVKNFRCSVCKIILTDPLMSIENVEDFIIVGPTKIKPKESTRNSALNLSLKMGIQRYDSSTMFGTTFSRRYCVTGCSLGDTAESLGNTCHPKFPSSFKMSVEVKGEPYNSKRIIDVDPPRQLKMRKDHPSWILCAEEEIKRLEKTRCQNSFGLPRNYFKEGANVAIQLSATLPAVNQEVDEDTSKNHSNMLAILKVVDSGPLNSKVLELKDCVMKLNRLKFDNAVEIACRFIKNRKSEGENDDSCDEVMVINDLHDISLKCQSTLLRMDVPVRGVKCEHLQCFDLEFFLANQPRTAAANNRWKCTICEKSCYPQDLMVDELMEKIMRENPFAIKVFLEPDAAVTQISWRVTEKEDQDLLDDLEDIDNNEDIAMMSALSSPSDLRRGGGVGGMRHPLRSANTPHTVLPPSSNSTPLTEEITHPMNDEWHRCDIVNVDDD